MKGGIGVEEQDADAAAALPHAVAPVGAPSVYLCGGAEERKGCNGYAAATFANAVVPVGEPSACCCGGERSAYCYGGAEESKGGDGEE